MASLTLLSKNSTACLLWPLWVCVRLLSRYDSTFRKCDLPEPKKPEIQMPILPVGSGFFALIHCFEIPGDELAEVLVEFPCDDELIQLLPDGGIVKLVGLHDAVDGPEDVTFKEILDEHVSLDLRNQLEGPVVVVVL